MISEQLGQFDVEFRNAMESITGKVSDFTWSFMGLGCSKGGLGLRIKARFPAIPAADLDGRISCLSTEWSSYFGKMPEYFFQRDFSAPPKLER